MKNIIKGLLSLSFIYFASTSLFCQNTFNDISLYISPLYGSTKIIEEKSIIGGGTSGISHKIDGKLGFNAMVLISVLEQKNFTLKSGLLFSNTHYKHQIINIRTASDPPFDISNEVHKWNVGIPVIASYRFKDNADKVHFISKLGLIPIRTFSTLDNLEISIEPGDPAFRNSSNEIKKFNLLAYAGIALVFPVSEAFSIELNPFYTQNLFKDKLYLRSEEVKDFAFGASLGFTLKI